MFAEKNNLLYDAEYYKEDLIKSVMPLLQYLVPESVGHFDETVVKALLLDHPVLRGTSQIMLDQSNAIVRSFNKIQSNLHIQKRRCLECNCRIDPTNQDTQFGCY